MQITYGYYAVEYGGKIIPEQGFQKAERQAEAYIRHLTYVKGDIFAVENDIVKDAVSAAHCICNKPLLQHKQHPSLYQFAEDGQKQEMPVCSSENR